MNQLADGLQNVSGRSFTDLALSLPAFFDIHDGIVTLVEPAEVDGPEEDAPDLVADLLEPDGEAPEEVRDEDLLPLPADGGVLRDEPELEVIRIGDLGRPSRERPE